MSSFYTLLFFLIAFVPTMVAPIFFPLVKLSYFIPLIVLFIYKKTTKQLFTYIFTIGLILDLLAAYTPFGFWIIVYAITSWIVLYLKPFFFEDKWLTFPILTLFFSQISTLIYALICYCFFKRSLFSILWLFTDLLAYPFFDALYAFVFFTLPLYFIRSPAQKNRYASTFTLTDS